MRSPDFALCSVPTPWRATLTITLTGREIERAYVDKGYRGHDMENPRRVFILGQKRGVFGCIKRELRRRSAIEAVIGHMKAEGHLGRFYLKGRAGDAANAIPQRRRLRPAPGPRLAADHFARHSIRPASELRESPSRQIGF
jgi:hypothetical protein